MKRKLIHICIGLTVLLAASLVMAKDRKGSLTGTWECQAHGGSQGDMAFTLYLQQNKELVDGSIASPIGATQFSSGTFRRNMLEIHIDTPQGGYVLMGKFEKSGKLEGNWASDTEKGVWEGKKQGAPAK
jgi:hypothetical protein